MFRCIGLVSLYFGILAGYFRDLGQPNDDLLEIGAISPRAKEESHPSTGSMDKNGLSSLGVRSAQHKKPTEKVKVNSMVLHY